MCTKVFFFRERKEGRKKGRQAGREGPREEGREGEGNLKADRSGLGAGVTQQIYKAEIPSTSVRRAQRRVYLKIASECCKTTQSAALQSVVCSAATQGN